MTKWFGLDPEPDMFLIDAKRHEELRCKACTELMKRGEFR